MGEMWWFSSLQAPHGTGSWRWLGAASLVCSSMLRHAGVPGAPEEMLWPCTELCVRAHALPHRQVWS